MFNHQDLENYYTVQAPEGSGETNLDLKTGYDDSVKIDVYYINKEIKDGPIEFFNIYSTGLVVFVRQTSSLIEIYSNREFSLNDDGIFYLISE